MAPWPPQRRDVGFVFQFYALYPHLTVRENVAFPLEGRELSPDTQVQRVEAMAERLGLAAILIAIPANSPEVTSSGYLWRVLWYVSLVCI